MAGGDEGSEDHSQSEPAFRFFGERDLRTDDGLRPRLQARRATTPVPITEPSLLPPPRSSLQTLGMSPTICILIICQQRLDSFRSEMLEA